MGGSIRSLNWFTAQPGFREREPAENTRPMRLKTGLIEGLPYRYAFLTDTQLNLAFGNHVTTLS